MAADFGAGPALIEGTASSSAEAVGRDSGGRMRTYDEYKIHKRSALLRILPRSQDRDPGGIAIDDSRLT